MNLTIRQAVRSDAGNIVDFNAAMALETEKLDLDRERLMRGVQAVLDDPSKGFYVVGEAGGAMVGQMMVTFEWSDWRNGTFWWIQSVYVPAEHRGKGIYRKLHEFLVEQARQQKMVCGLRLYVEKENLRARQIYERLGMRRTAYEMYEVDFVLQRGAETV